MGFLKVSGISLQEEGNLVLQNISFTQKEFQKVAIAGETGSGKSSLLQTIAGLVQPSAGQVLFRNKKVIGPHDQLIPGHPGIAYLSQQFELPPFLRVEQVLKYANTLTQKKADNLYDLCRITHLLKRKTNQLSGGERQRIAMARLLLSGPEIFLLDEPFSNLDMVHKKILKSVIRGIGAELDITLTLISHDPLDTLSWADQIMVMQGGKIVQKGKPEQIYQKPINSYVAGLFGPYNQIPTAQAKDLFGITGLKPNQKNLLIRPEQFCLVTAKDHGIAGEVAQVNYFGSYYEIEVRLKEILITVKTERADIKKNDTVYIALSTDILKDAE